MTEPQNHDQNAAHQNVSPVSAAQRPRCRENRIDSHYQASTHRQAMSAGGAAGPGRNARHRRRNKVHQRYSSARFMMAGEFDPPSFLSVTAKKTSSNEASA